MSHQEYTEPLIISTMRSTEVSKLLEEWSYLPWTIARYCCTEYTRHNATIEHYNGDKQYYYSRHIDRQFKSLEDAKKFHTKLTIFLRQEI